MDSRTEKKIEKALDRADREHDKAAVLEAKGRLGSADRHEQKAATLEQRAGQLAQGVSAGGPAYTGLNFPYSNSAAHPTYGYHRLPRDKKAERFEAKAVAWEQRGNAMKAQKNRDKALRHRQRMMPGYVPIAHPQPYYVSKADRLDQRALRYQQMGLLPQAQRYQQRALRVRSKHNVPASSTMALPMTGMTQYSTLPAGTTYRGLNQPYTGATQHPKFGYAKLTSDQKSQRYTAKAAEWERRGDMMKAQKNRDKANRYRMMNQAGYTKPTRSQDYYINRATNLDAKAVRYQQLGRNDQALRAQQRAQRIRTKHNIPLGAGLAGAGVGTGAGLGALGATGTRSQYSGLGLPYTGATQHPKFGYAKLTPAQKAQRFELKAAEWQKRGNAAKAQKNRDKANRYRMMGTPGFVRPTRDNTYYTNRAQNFDQRALRYQQMGRSDAALRAQQRAQRIRSKHNIPLGTGLAGAGMTGLGNNQGRYLADGTYIGPIVPVGTVYKGLSHPYTGASAHPKFGYMRLSPADKATRFEAKAAEWERRGNMAKAQKNREKANRYRMRTQPGYVKPTRAQDYYINRANTLDQRSHNYRQMGRNDQALRAQQRAQRIRTKHGLPLAAAGTGFGSSFPMTSSTTTYSGINFPYTGAAAHPTYGYQRLPHNKKAERFELKAAEWERRGNLKKAEKNRMKAQKYRARSQPGYVAPVRPQTYYVDRANTFDQRALQYQQWGMLPQAQRYQGRAQRVRAKRGLPAFAGAAAPMRPSYQYNPTATYSGINFPYTGAAAHPTYGYQRLPHNKKAERFELKAAEWERRGNLRKAEKNRMKAQKYRARSQPGYVAPVRPQTYYVDRANAFDQRALQYQQWGMLPQAQRYQGRAQRVRAKRGLPLPAAGTTQRPLYTTTATY